MSGFLETVLCASLWEYTGTLTCHWPAETQQALAPLYGCPDDFTFIYLFIYEWHRSPHLG